MNESLEALVQRTGLLADMAPRSIKELLGRVAVQTYEAGAFIVTEGEIGDAAYVLLEGSVQVLGSKPDGEWVPLARLEPGALFGEQALVGRAAGRRAATVRAIGVVKVARIGADDFHRALPEDHHFFKQLVDLGEAQLRERLAKQSLLFRALLASDDDKAEAFDLGAELVTFERGQALFYQGEPSDAVFVVVSGAAGVYTDNEGQPQLVARIEAGQCVGERGLLRREPHTNTAIAEERLTAFRIPGDRFMDLHARSPGLRDYLQSLERIHELPRRGFVTQFAGQFLGRECITSVYHLPRGRRAVASHVPGETLHHLEVQAPGQNIALESVEEHRFVNLDLGVERKIVVSRSGKLISLTARGEWDELPELFVLALDGGALLPWQLAAFVETGSTTFEAPPTFFVGEEIVCTCMQVRRRTIREAILAGCDTAEAVRDRCRAGSACGACMPRIREMLGKSAWTSVRVIAAIDVAHGIRAFRFVPMKEKVMPARPGQHVVLQAQIEGRWIERPYTLSAPTSNGYYEVTAKRIPGGLFSTWLFDRRTPDALIRVSAPQGDFTPDAGDGPLVYLVAGIGVTPALAACRAFAGGKRTIHVDYSVRSAAQAAYTDELGSLAAASPNLSVHVRYTEHGERINAIDVGVIVAANPDADYFLCGPASYLREMQSALREEGVPAARIHSEEFVSAGEGTPPMSVAMSLRLIAAGPRSRAIVATEPPSSRITLLPDTLSSTGVSAGGPVTSRREERLPRPPGVCPAAHGTHRDDGLGMVPPVVAGAGTSILEEARAYLVQFFRDKGAPKAFAARWAQVSAEIERTGTYVQSYDELSFGAKLAWRNSTRCIGRLFWNGLMVRDMRHLTTEDEMLAALVEHIDLATNGGNLRALMTVFPPAGPDGKGPRIWNGQLLRYAGYRAFDGSVTGDPMNVDLTEQAFKLGWKGGPRTRFDLLPLIVQLPGKAPKWMEIPKRIVREVPISHPEHPWFMNLGLKWYALPAVSDVLFDVGGVKYTAAPFNGWYMATEIGARNFSDPQRYNLLPVVAEKLGLDTRRAASLWMDRAQIELVRAVSYSFERAGVKLVDHHTASEDFTQFIEMENAAGRCVHMRWSWITPPVGGSTTKAFHLDEDHYPDISLKPNFFYQKPAFK
jgi:nitric-oxide synthase